jgi:putative oxidoreductase
LQRLYSTFADSWPGLGLLFMRLVVGSVLLLGATPKLWNQPPFQTIVTSAPLAGSGLLLIMGLWTPLAGMVVAAIEAWEILRVNEDPVAALLACTIAGALAMLGPGRWSVDAKLFGWKKIEAPPRRSGSSAL